MPPPIITYIYAYYYESLFKSHHRVEMVEMCFWRSNNASQRRKDKYRYMKAKWWSSRMGLNFNIITYYMHAHIYAVFFCSWRLNRENIIYLKFWIKAKSVFALIRWVWQTQKINLMISLAGACARIHTKKKKKMGRKMGFVCRQQANMHVWWQRMHEYFQLAFMFDASARPYTPHPGMCDASTASRPYIIIYGWRANTHKSCHKNIVNEIYILWWRSA